MPPKTYDEAALRQAWQEGLTSYEIARLHGVSRNIVTGLATRRGWKHKPKPMPPEPPPPRVDPPWSTVFTRLDEEHAKMDRVLAETRNVGRLHGM